MKMKGFRRGRRVSKGEIRIREKSRDGRRWKKSLREVWCKEER